MLFQQRSVLQNNNVYHVGYYRIILILHNNYVCDFVTNHLHTALLLPVKDLDDANDAKIRWSDVQEL